MGRSKFRTWFRSPRHDEPTVKLDRRSRLSTRARKRRSKRGVVLEKKGSLATYLAKRRRKRTVKIDKPMSTNVYRLVPAVAVVLVVAVLLVDRLGGPDEGGDREAGAAADAGTTVAAPTTTAPLDDIQVCRARDAFMAASLAVDHGQDPASVATGLQHMSTALVGLGGADAHPDLVASVQVLEPVVNDALVAVAAATAEDLASFAEDPRFTDPSFGSAVTTIASYPLNCPVER